MYVCMYVCVPGQWVGWLFTAVYGITPSIMPPEHIIETSTSWLMQESCGHAFLHRVFRVRVSCTD